MARVLSAFIAAALLGAPPVAADTLTPQATKPQATEPQTTTPRTSTPPTATPRPSSAAPAADQMPAYRAALLVQAPELLPTKTKTFIGHVTWALTKDEAGALAAQATIEVPTAKMTAVVTFAKNTDSTLPAAETIAVRFAIEPGSSSGNVWRIAIPQMRVEDDPSGQPLLGVAVQVVPNSFLAGLRADKEASNLASLKGLQWIDIPMLLENGKIAKLTFEKGDAGQHAIDAAAAAWQKP